MIIKHLSHSGFMVEDQVDLLVFDAISPIDVTKEYENLYIFVSHSHKDHFEPSIVKNFYNKKNTNIILSKELSPKVSKSAIQNLFMLDNYENITVKNVDISSYGSTDLGSSFLVSLNGKHYFHSGDLNWWHWNRMTQEELEAEEISFKREVDLLQGKIIDFAFIPVDPRLVESSYLAINYFIEVVKPKYVIPMHAFGQYDFYKDLALHIDLHDSVLINVDGENKIIFEDK